MQILNLLGRALLYLIRALGYSLGTIVIVALAIAIKYLAIPLADKFLYTIIILGLLLKGIEIIELLNILVFSIVGMGFGVATVLLPTQIGRQVSAALLITIVPFIFFITPIVRYNNWIETIGVNESIPPMQAEALTNSFLKRKVGIPGFMGFYLYTAQFPVLPTKQTEMNDRERLEKSVNSKFVQLTGIPPTVVSWTMAICFWCIRIFYFAIAAIATIAHFREGLRIVKR
ncbi:MAG: hypothetical protein ACM37W_23670 [Actinomycetota bacterium]